jgi:uncharacterized protein with LGFP repeats
MSAIDDKYAALGGPSGFLGAPVHEERPTMDGVGRHRWFQGGAIYWHPQTGAHEIHGAILAKWEELDFEVGFLGYPLTDETPCSCGGGRFNHFQGGSIYWAPETGAHEVHGAIRDFWADEGWECSRWGYPTTDEMPTSDGRGRHQRFETWSLVWRPETGVEIPEG